MKIEKIEKKPKSRHVGITARVCYTKEWDLEAVMAHIRKTIEDIKGWENEEGSKIHGIEFVISTFEDKK